MNNVICKGCGHTTKPGLVDENGLCPVCRPAPEEEEEPKPEKRGKK